MPCFFNWELFDIQINHCFFSTTICPFALFGTINYTPSGSDSNILMAHAVSAVVVVWALLVVYSR